MKNPPDEIEKLAEEIEELYDRCTVDLTGKIGEPFKAIAWKIIADREARERVLIEIANDLVAWDNCEIEYDGDYVVDVIVPKARQALAKREG